MANTKAAKKDIRQSTKRRTLNDVKRKNVKESVKIALKAVQEKSNNTQELVNKAQKALDKAARQNVIHYNKASRMKSRLQKAFNAVTGKSST